MIIDWSGEIGEAKLRCDMAKLRNRIDAIDTELCDIGDKIRALKVRKLECKAKRVDLSNELYKLTGGD